MGFGMDIFYQALLHHLISVTSRRQGNARDQVKVLIFSPIETVDSGFQRNCWAVKGPQSQFSSLWINPSVFYVSKVGESMGTCEIPPGAT